MTPSIKEKNESQFSVETPFADFVLQEQDVFRDPKDAEKVLKERKK